jgi:quercetin 2,3-dioxygenase
MDKNIKSIKQLGFQWQTQDPFLFCAFHHDLFPKGRQNLEPDSPLEGRAIGQDFSGKDGWSMYHGSKVPGFPAHPHKGFETITLVEKGLVDHSDSLGAAGRFGEGDTQWMTAGKGVMHSEMFPMLKEDQENELLLFQIWLNLPKKKKNVPAHFKMMWKENIPVVRHLDENKLVTSIKLIAGGYGDTPALSPAPDSYAADPDNQVAIWHINMDKGASFTLPKVFETTDRSLFFYSGSSLIAAGEKIHSGHSVDLATGAPFTIKNGDTPASLILLQGKPINEKVVQHGPFVMNSNEEIQEAVYEFQRTQFGGWPWKSHENTHDREKGRFAIHADGKEEIK